MRRRKNFIGLCVLITLISYASYKTFSNEQRIIAVGVIVFIAVGYILYLVNRIKPQIPEDFPHEFTTNPELFDRKYISMQGRVVKVFSDCLAEGVKRKVIDKYRTWTKNDDTRGRYSHLRFLIKGPQLKHGQYILVEHNLKFGKLPVRKGCVVALKGEYIHENRDHFYGKIHNTHIPNGYLELVTKKKYKS